MPFVLIKKRGYRPLAVVVCFGLVCAEQPLSLLLTRHLVNREHRRAFAEVAQRGQPIVDAVEKYKANTGALPERLEDLTPDYLAEVPGTVLAGYPDFLYALASADTIFKAYQIYVRTPQGGPNWDMCVYWPEGNYPEYFDGGYPEFFGPWAYVHE